MKHFVKENVANVNVGNALFIQPITTRERIMGRGWNSFSIPPSPIDRYPRSKKMIGKLNPKLQEMKM